MPLLGGLIASLFGWLAKFVIDWFGKRVANRVLIVGTFTAVFAAVMTALKLALEAVAGEIPGANWLLVGLSIGIPPTAATFLSIYAGIWAACRLYRWQVKAIEYVSGA